MQPPRTGQPRHARERPGPTLDKPQAQRTGLRYTGQRTTDYGQRTSGILTLTILNRQSSIFNDHASIRRALLHWFRRHARPLPWRKRKDAYAVWVSEVMLQQTQVATVIPYYRRFLRAFPTLARLAEAPLERVLELWSGLGYYRRARCLHLAAQRVAQEFGGIFPRDYEQAHSLPGVGYYTARAVLSIAYNLPYSVLDGNVARVVARLWALRGSLHQPRFRRAVECELDALLSPRQPGKFNQALMELGQTTCLPRAPRCPACPLRKWCRAYRLGRPELYPQPRPRRATEFQYLAVAVVCRNVGALLGPFLPDAGKGVPVSPALEGTGLAAPQRGQVALVRGLDEGLMADLWNFPAAFGRSRAEALNHLRHKLAGIVRSPMRWGAPLVSPGLLRHRITHRSILVDLYPAEIPPRRGEAVPRPKNSLRWFPLSRLPHLAVSQLARKIATTVGTIKSQSKPRINADRHR